MDEEFLKRRDDARSKINALDHQPEGTERNGFFRSVYDRAGDDPALVPWADLAPKKQLVDWLNGHKSDRKTALDIACGLGDNAEAIAEAGYNTTGFDISDTAIDWANKRFENSPVNYQAADLFNPPAEWGNGFDLVHECYTLQALSPELFEETASAIAALVKPSGTLLVYTRTRLEGSEVQGPPFPLTDSQTEIFAKLGFDLVSNTAFEIERPDKSIPHRFMEWQKTNA